MPSDLEVTQAISYFDGQGELLPKSRKHFDTLVLYIASITAENKKLKEEAKEPTETENEKSDGWK